MSGRVMAVSHIAGADMRDVKCQNIGSGGYNPKFSKERKLLYIDISASGQVDTRFMASSCLGLAWFRAKPTPSFTFRKGKERWNKSVVTWLF